jgi:hypothetical protein
LGKDILMQVTWLALSFDHIRGNGVLGTKPSSHTAVHAVVAFKQGQGFELQPGETEFSSNGR